jgi:hypothetical protein
MLVVDGLVVFLVVASVCWRVAVAWPDEVLKA